MFIDSWRRWLHRVFKILRRSASRNQRAARRFRPWVQRLETRATPASINLPPIADNTLYQDPTGHLSDGSGQHFYVGETNQGSNNLRRGAIKFDVSAIPAAATITSARLILNLSKNAGGTATVALHRALKDWGEGTSNSSLGGTGSGEGDGIQAKTNDATWLFTFFNAQRWTTPGGDFVTAASASTLVGDPNIYQWSGAGVIADVRQWINTPATNFGWIVTGNETTNRTAKEFDTKENSNPDARPVLAIVYTLSPDLTITKSHTGNFRQGDLADTYALTVTNSGVGPVAGTVTVTDTLPAGLAPTPADGGTINGWIVSFTGQKITAIRTSALASGSSYPTLTLTVSVAGNAPASVTNIATVSGGGEVNTSNDSASDSTTIAAQVADLTIAKSHTGAFRQRDVADTYALNVTNIGSGPTAGTVTVTDTLPAGLTPTAADSGTINGWTVAFTGQTITATRGDVLANGNSYPALILTVSVAGNAPASVTNMASVAGGGEVNTSNDSAGDPTTIAAQVADLTIAASHTDNFRQEDAADTFTLTVTNIGSVPTAGTVTVTDTLPAGLAPTAADNGTINGWLVSFTGQTVTATRGDVLANGNSYPALIVTVSVAKDASVGDAANTAIVAGGGEVNTSNDGASDSTTILARGIPLAAPLIGATTHLEGQTGYTAFNFRVSLPAAPAHAATYAIFTTDGSAVSVGANPNFVAIAAGVRASHSTGMVTFDVGQVSQTITVYVIAGSIPASAGARTFTISLSDPVHPSVRMASAVGTIIPQNGGDSGLAKPLIGATTHLEGQSGYTAFNFRVSLPAPPAHAATYDIYTTDGSAVSVGANPNFVAIAAGVSAFHSTGMVTFDVGQVSQTITVYVSAGSIPVSAGATTFTISLSDPAHPAIPLASAIGTIIPQFPDIFGGNAGNA